MPFDTPESFAAALAATGIAEEIFMAIKNMPPAAERKAVDWAPVVDIFKAKGLPLIDQIQADVAD